jgi:hypothetical protein
VKLLRRQNLAPLRFALTNFFAHVSPRRNILTLSGIRKKSLALGRAQRTESHERKARVDAIIQKLDKEISEKIEVSPDWRKFRGAIFARREELNPGRKRGPDS